MPSFQPYIMPFAPDLFNMKDHPWFAGEGNGTKMSPSHGPGVARGQLLHTLSAYSEVMSTPAAVVVSTVIANFHQYFMVV